MNPLQSAKNELEELLKQRTEIDRRISAIQQTVKILEPVYGTDPRTAYGTLRSLASLAVDTDAGLTYRIREVLRTTPPGANTTPTGIRNLLIHTGFDAEGRSNFL